MTREIMGVKHPTESKMIYAQKNSETVSITIADGGYDRSWVSLPPAAIRTFARQLYRLARLVEKGGVPQ